MLCQCNYTLYTLKTTLYVASRRQINKLQNSKFFMEYSIDKDDDFTRKHCSQNKTCAFVKEESSKKLYLHLP